MVNYTEGDLTPEMRDRITRHLQSCNHCTAVYDGSRNIVRLLGDKNAVELPRGFSRRLYRRYVPRAVIGSQLLSKNPDVTYPHLSVPVRGAGLGPQLPTSR
ncbi:MAG: zf-HC2 domain-containing protein [Terriglobales bacterium]